MPKFTWGCLSQKYAGAGIVSTITMMILKMRQWKYATFAVGLTLLIVGSYCLPAPDWDVSISIIMATFAFLTAGWSIDVLLLRQWKKLPLALFFTWWTVDGCYWLYWSVVDQSALVMRDANFGASLCLYLMCGLVWSNQAINFVAQRYRRCKMN